MQQLIAAQKSEIKRNRNAAKARDAQLALSHGSPPIMSALEEAGLSCYARRLVDDYSCSTVAQLLALDTTTLDALLDALRPLPGHRVRLVQFLNRERERAGRDAAAGVMAPQPSASQQRKWRASAASLRSGSSKRGTESDATYQHQRGWTQPAGSGGSRAPSTAQAVGYTSKVRVIKVGKSRVTVYDGPKPNSPLRGRGGMAAPSRGTLGLSCTIGCSDGFAADATWPDVGPSWSRPVSAAPARTKASLSQSLKGTVTSTHTGGFAANLAGAVEVDWSKLSAKLPTGKDAESAARREELWNRSDPNGNGYLSQAEVDLMVREAVGEALFTAKPVIALSFHAARRTGGGKQVGTQGDFIERSEFRVL